MVWLHILSKLNVDLGCFLHCTAKRLSSNVRQFGDPDNQVFESGSKTRTFAFDQIKKNFINETGRSQGHVQKRLQECLY
jgi:hypothetical protein